MNNMLVFLHNGKLTLEDFEHVAIHEDEPSDPPAVAPFVDDTQQSAR